MSGAEHIAANVIGPIRGHIAVATSTTTELVMTLSSTSHLGNDKADWYGQFLTLQPDGGDVYFFLSTDGSASPGGSITKTNAATGNARPWLVKDGQRFDFRLARKKNAAGVFAWTTKLWHEASAATVLRVYPSSANNVKAPNEAGE
jgi:hypothetical protein